MFCRGKKTLLILGIGLAAAVMLAARPTSAQTVDVLKSHNDLANTGQNLQETVLTPALLRAGRFGLLFTIPVDTEVGPNKAHNLSGSQIYAQPLYMAGLPLPNGERRNVLFVATEHDSVYAFDADTGAALWERTDFVEGKTRHLFRGNGDLQPEVGITGTPVIDAATGTLYVVVLTMENEGKTPADFHQRLYALDCASGANKFAPGFPVEITATAMGTEGRPETGPIAFRPDLANQRCGLVLNQGKVYIAWASFQDKGPYHGWVIAYDARTGATKATLNISPSVDKYGAGIWQSGGSPSIDAAGNLYITTGNGVFDPPTGNWGECFLKLDGSTLQVTDYFCPYNHIGLDASDADLGTSGLLLLPDSAGSEQHRHLMLSGGKVGILYMLDRDDFGKFDAAKNNVVQEIEVPREGDGVTNKFGNGLYSVPAYFNGAVYYLRTGEYIKRVPIVNGHLNEAQTVANKSQRFGFPGATPSISANGTDNGIVWATESYYPTGLNMQDHADPGHMRLHAYDATTLDELFNSGDTAPTIDGTVYRNFMKFNPPTVTNGHVYVATGGAILVYGVKSPLQGANVTAQVEIKRGKIEADKVEAAEPNTIAPCMAVLDRFTAPDVPAFGPNEIEAPIGNWTNGITPDNLPGNGLAQHSMLYVGENYNKMFLVDKGKVIWTYSTGTGYEYDDVWMLSNGNILYTRMEYIEEITPDKKVVWRYDCNKAPGINHTEIHACQPLGLDRVMFVVNGLPPKLMVVNIKTKAVEVDHELPCSQPTNPNSIHGQFRRARVTAQGTYLVSFLTMNQVVEYDKDFNEIWKYTIKSPWAAIRLKNGNTLITDEAEHLTREVNRKGETVWEFNTDDLPEAYRFASAPQTCTRLANGNTIFTSRGNNGKGPQLVEITPDKKVVWVLQDWKTLGGATAVQILDDPGIPENPGESEH